MGDKLTKLTDPLGIFGILGGKPPKAQSDDGTSKRIAQEKAAADEETKQLKEAELERRRRRRSRVTGSLSLFSGSELGIPTSKDKLGG